MSLPTHTPIELVLHQVSYRYPSADALALSGINVRLCEGKVLGVLGPNGSGKSTLLRIATGLLAPSAGTASINGLPMNTLGAQERAKRVAVVGTDDPVAFGFRVREVVAMGRAPHLGLLSLQRHIDREQCEQIMHECDVWEFRDRQVQQLSAGERKRVAIARALAQQTDIVLLDEPTAFLDVHHQIATLELIRIKAQQHQLATMVVLHDLNLAAQFCDWLLLLRAGKQVAQGPIEEVMTYRQIRETFDCEIYVGLNEINQTRYFVPMRRQH